MAKKNKAKLEAVKTTDKATETKINYIVTVAAGFGTPQTFNGTKTVVDGKVISRRLCSC